MQRADPLAFRQAASRCATGVAVLTALDPRGEACGMTANSFVTISLAPPTVLVSVKSGRTHDAVSASRRYGVNVLPEQAQALSKHFADRSRDTCLDHEIVDDLPRLSNCVAFFACEVIRTIDVNDHTLFIAEVSGCDHSDHLPLVFFSSRYHLGPGKPAER